MKRVRRLTRREKIMLDKLGYNPKEFLRLSKSAQGFIFLERSTGKTLPVRG